MDLSKLSDEELMRAAGGGGAPAPAQIDYSTLPDDVLMKAAGIDAAAPVPQQQEPGFMQRLQDDFARRKNQFVDLYNQSEQGKMSKTEAGLLGGLKLGLIPSDIAGNVISTVTPDFIKEPVVKAIQDGAAYLADTRAGRMAIGAVNDINQNYPAASRRLSAVGDVVTIAAPFTKVGGTSLVGASTKAAGEVADTVTSKALVPLAEKLAVPRQVIPNSEQLTEMSKKAYEAARASGEVFDPSVSNKFVNALDAAKPKKIAGAVETELSQSLESGLGKYREILDKPLNIDEIDIIDKDLSNLKDQAYSAGKNQLASQFSNIQNTLRDSVATSSSGQTLAQARDLFRRKYQMEDVERIFRNAEGRPNEATIIQTGYRNLANQARKKGSGYTKEQIALMDEAAKGGLDIDALKFASSKLIAAVAAATGGPVAGAAAYMGNLAAGAGATALQTAKANRLAKSITDGITVQGEPTRLNRALSRFTRQDLQDALDAKKGTQ